MKASVFYGPGDIRIEDRPEPKIQNPTDAVVKILYCCVCGSDLWFYRGETENEKGATTGHELLGRVETVGSDVKKIKAGDLVVCPFTLGDGTCPECKANAPWNCRNKARFNSPGLNGTQGEKARIPYADANLFAIPDKKEISDDEAKRFLPLSDVLCTGHHAAVCARVGKGSVVAVVGDGAVGLCGVAASKRLGAKRIILISTHPDRAEVGKKLGATDIIAARGNEAIAKVKKLTDDLGVDCVLECVGTQEAWDMAFGLVRAGGDIGIVGLPHNVADIPVDKFFRTMVGIKGSGAVAAVYIPELMPDVISGKLDVSAVFTSDFTLDQIAEAYKAMDERKAIKSFIKV